MPQIDRPDIAPMVHQTLLGDAWDHADVAVSVFSDDGRFIACNEAFCRLTGYGRDEIGAMRVGRELAADAERSAKLFREVVSDARRTGTVGLRRKDGATLDVNFWVIETRVASLPYFVVVHWERKKGPKRRFFTS